MERDLNIAIELALSNAKNSDDTTPLEEDNTGFVLKDRIFIKEGYRHEKIMLDTIYYLKAEGSYTDIVTEKKKYTVSENLNYFYQRLKHESFIRVHRSWLINVEKIEAFEENQVIINNKCIPLGKTYRNTFKTRFRFL